MYCIIFIETVNGHSRQSFLFCHWIGHVLGWFCPFAGNQPKFIPLFTCKSYHYVAAVSPLSTRDQLTRKVLLLWSIRQWNTPRENSMFGIIPIVSLTLKWTQNGNLNQSVIYTIRIVLISVCYKLKSQTSNPCVSGRNDPKVIHTRRFQSILRINFTFHWFPPFRFLATVRKMIVWTSYKIIFIAPAWPKQVWYTERLSVLRKTTISAIKNGYTFSSQGQNSASQLRKFT
jgi:hypothetical protein